MKTSPPPGSTTKSGLRPAHRLGPLDVLVVAPWCGLAAGLLEVGTRVLFHNIGSGRLYLMNRHFVWLGPLSNLLLFTAMGLVLAVATKLWPRIAGWISPRLVCFWAVLPLLMVVSTRIYTLAWVIVALAAAFRLAPILERSAGGLRRRLLVIFPVLLLLVLVAVSTVFGGDWVKQRREASRPLPPGDSPNVLLIVLDTVRADRLSAFGYERPTTPNLERMAQRGILFKEARAPAPWTLASHASFFTGRWPHELGAQWMSPLRRNFPTLAEFLGSHGYATAGFIANTLYCSYDTGLDRGFTHYDDYALGRISALRTSWLVDRTLNAVFDLGLFVLQWVDVGSFRVWPEALLQTLLPSPRKDAGSINREFLAWLSRRREPGRPFFAFLNYLDAHTPYLPPDANALRFGLKPGSEADITLLQQWASSDKLVLSQRARTLARDSYDNCLVYLDGRLGELFAEIERRGVLEDTLVIITSDHGEGLGEHDLFEHGESLYRTELGVPLLFVLPARRQIRKVVSHAVSLRDLPATIVDQVGLVAGAPFPGRSLARHWRDSSPDDSSDAGHGDSVMSELDSPNPLDANQGRSPVHRGPLISLAAGDFVYIRNAGDGAEELFNEREDPRELTNRAGVEAMQPVLNQFRERLNQMNAKRSGAVR
jgi:arylsulfatase A-like enzyme